MYDALGAWRSRRSYLSRCSAFHTCCFSVHSTITLTESWNLLNSTSKWRSTLLT